MGEPVEEEILQSVKSSVSGSKMTLQGFDKVSIMNDTADKHWTKLKKLDGQIKTLETVSEYIAKYAPFYLVVSILLTSISYSMVDFHGQNQWRVIARCAFVLGLTMILFLS